MVPTNKDLNIDEKIKCLLHKVEGTAQVRALYYEKLEWNADFAGGYERSFVL